MTISSININSFFLDAKNPIFQLVSPKHVPNLIDVSTTTVYINRLGLAPPILETPLDEPQTKPLIVKQLSSTTVFLVTLQL